MTHPPADPPRPDWARQFDPFEADQRAGLDMLQTLAVTSPLPVITPPRPERTPRVPSPAVRRPVVAPRPIRADRRPVRHRRQGGLAAGQERVGHLAQWHARRKTGPLLAGMLATYAVIVWWALRHAALAEDVADGHAARAPYSLAYAVVFILLAWQMTACFLERPKKRRRGQRDQLVTVVVIPVYNEDPQLFGDCLDSLLSQSRRPSMVFVTDDGSDVDYSEIRTRFELEADALDVAVTWVRTENRGKRHAQAEAFARTPDADIYITGDSDVILDYHGIEEVMKPFADRRVQSVAGVLLLANNRKNLITRTTELWYVTSELIDRSALSALSSVLVNTGTFAAYRADVIRANLAAYTHELFFGREVQFSDDSLLTFYALMAGKAVQQPTAFGFTAMPDNLSHHVRQYVRWMRGMTIRTFWRFRYLPIRSYVYWVHLFRWLQACITIPLFLVIFCVDPVRAGHLDTIVSPRIPGLWLPAALTMPAPHISRALLIIPILVGYGRSLRYLTIRRYDEPWWQQLLTYLMAPLVALWTYTVLRMIWWYGMATCRVMSWGTRQDGAEVALDES